MEVSTKEELKQAQQEGAEEIIVTGKLAKQLYAARKEALLLISAVGVTFIITLIQGYDNWEYDFKRQKLKLSKSRR